MRNSRNFNIKNGVAIKICKTEELQIVGDPRNEGTDDLSLIAFTILATQFREFV